MHILSRPRSAPRTLAATSPNSAALWPRVKQWARAIVTRTRGFALVLSIFVTAFAATVVLRIIIWLAVLAIKSL